VVKPGASILNVYQSLWASFSSLNSVSVMSSPFIVGGGYAEFVGSHETLLMPIPKSLSFNDAAAIPEVWLTAFQLLHFVGMSVLVFVNEQATHLIFVTVVELCSGLLSYLLLLSLFLSVNFMYIC